MTSSERYRFEPDYAIPPGDTLAEVLESKAMPQKELALRTGLTTKTIQAIVRGNNPITATTAALFETVLGIDAQFWLNLEDNYRVALVRQEERVQAGINEAREMVSVCYSRESLAARPGASFTRVSLTGLPYANSVRSTGSRPTNWPVDRNRAPATSAGALSFPVGIGV